MAGHLPLDEPSHEVRFQFGEKDFGGHFGIRIEGPISNTFLLDSDNVSIAIQAPVAALPACGDAIRRLFLGDEPLVPPLVGKTFKLHYVPDGEIPSGSQLSAMIGAAYRAMVRRLTEASESGPADS